VASAANSRPLKLGGESGDLRLAVGRKEGVECPGEPGPLGRGEELNHQGVYGLGDNMSEDELIRRATADRNTGRNSNHYADKLFSIAAKRNHAALDRLDKESIGGGSAWVDADRSERADRPRRGSEPDE